MAYPYSSHYLIQSLSFFSSHLALPLYKSRLWVALYFISLFSWYHNFLNWITVFRVTSVISGLFSDHFSVVFFYHQPLFDFALSILTNCHGRSLAVSASSALRYSSEQVSLLSRMYSQQQMRQSFVRILHTAPSGANIGVCAVRNAKGAWRWKWS